MGHEALAVRRRQLFEPFYHGFQATFARVVNGATPKWGKTGTENNARIQQIGIADDTVAEAGDSFIDEPLEVPFINNWKRVLSAVPDFTKRLYEAVEMDNRPRNS